MARQRGSTRRPPRRQRKQPMEVRTGTAGKVLIMLAIVAAIVLGVAIFFQVRQVEVQGNRIYAEDQVVEISGVEPGDNLLMVNKAQVVGNIHANLPYIQKVSVGRILPDTIVIKVEESEVAGLIETDTGTQWLVNAEGRVMGSSTQGFDGQVIALTGFTIQPPTVGAQAVATPEMEEELEAALTVLRSMDGTGLMDQVTAIQAEKSFDIHLFCGEQYEVLLAGTDDLDYKIWYLQEVLKTLDPYKTGTIDMTQAKEKAAHFYPWEEKE